MWSTWEYGRNGVRINLRDIAKRYLTLKLTKRTQKENWDWEENDEFGSEWVGYRNR